MLIPKKYHIHVVALLAVAVIIFVPNLRKKIDPEILTRGTAAAEEFLALVDAEDYAGSREISSALLQERIVVAVWHRQISVMRDKVGPLLSREQKEAILSDTAEGAPDGEYLILKYASVFEKQKEATETIILAQDADKQWRVAGYFIK